ncbi:hypothetical protein ACFL35_06930 [Candidatus Riflebacteria bacterium]
MLFPGQKFTTLLCFLLICLPGLDATASYVGPTGYLTIPSNEVIKSGKIEIASHFRSYTNPDDKSFFEWSMKANLGFKDLLEIGIENTVDDEQVADDLTPVIHFKMKLSREHHHFLRYFAMGLCIETDEENYSSAYFMYKNIGLAWNFGGIKNRGLARFGSYNTQKGEPESFALLLGFDSKKDLKEDLGLGRLVFDYNGDYFSSGWLFDFSEDFKGEIVFSSPSKYGKTGKFRKKGSLWLGLSRRF